MDTYGYFYVTALELATSQNHNKTKQNRLFIGQLVLVLNLSNTRNISTNFMEDPDDMMVDEYLNDLYADCSASEIATSTSSYQTTAKSKQRQGDLFEDIFTQSDNEEEPEPAAKKSKVSGKPLAAEIKEFRDSRVPMRDPIGFWKYSRLTRLRVCAKIIFSVSVSSAGIERLFSEAGMLLTKRRRRMLPKIMKKLVYIRYEKKYRKWIDRLGISVSEEELKKGLEEEEDVEELDEDMIE